MNENKTVRKCNGELWKTLKWKIINYRVEKEEIWRGYSQAVGRRQMRILVHEWVNPWGGIIQSLSRVWLFETPGTAAHQASLSITIFQSLFKLMSIESVTPLNNLIFCSPLLLLPSTFPSIRVFSNESALCVRWPKYWSFSFSISPSKEYSGLISFRNDWFDLLAVQGTLKDLLQDHSSKASILQCSAFFMVQFSHPYMPTGKTLALTIQTFVGKVLSQLFNMLLRFVIVFLPRRKHILISNPWGVTERFKVIKWYCAC